jgi:hypothetical protein
LKTKNEQVIPVKPVNRDTIYNKCTVQKADEGNWRAEKYCESFGDNYLACNQDAGKICQQKCGKGHESIKITLPKESPDGL